jgi:hypothetical protein
MMTNVDAYTGSYINAPPFGWSGPNIYQDLPEGTNDTFYEFFIKIPLDSLGTNIDTLLWLVMLSPDIWDTLYQDSLITGFETWLIGQSRNDLYFWATVQLPDTESVAGNLKWNWTATWWNYEFNTSTIDESGEVTITSSNNIRLSAHFLWDAEGAGGPEDNWGKFQATKFVQFTFFAEPDENGYDGYYELASQGWKVKHYFKLYRQPES